MSAAPDIARALAALEVLTEVAASAGVAPSVIEDASTVGELFVELSQWRRGLRDPRRARSLENAKRLGREHGRLIAAGYTTAETIHALRERFGYGRSQLFELLRLYRQSGDISGPAGATVGAAEVCPK